MRNLCFLLVLILASCESEYSKVPFAEELEELPPVLQVDYLRKELQYQPDNPSILIKLAQSYTTTNLDSAIFYGQLALANSQEQGTLYFTMAQIYKDADDPAGAIAYGLKAEESGLVSSALKNLIAEQYLASGDYAKADLYLSQALQLADADQNAIFMQAQLQLVKGDTAGALSRLQTVSDKSLQYSRLMLLGDIAFDRGEDSLAASSFNKASNLKPAESEPHRKLSLAHEKMGNLELAVNELKSIDMGYDDVMRVAGLYYETLDWDSTIHYTGFAKKLDSTAVDPFLLEAKVLVGRREFASARYVYDSLLSADSTNIQAEEGIEFLNGRIRYLLRQQEEKKKEDSIRFRPLKIREF